MPTSVSQLFWPRRLCKRVLVPRIVYMNFTVSLHSLSYINIFLSHLCHWLVRLNYVCHEHLLGLLFKTRCLILVTQYRFLNQKCHGIWTDNLWCTGASTTDMNHPLLDFFDFLNWIMGYCCSFVLMYLETRSSETLERDSQVDAWGPSHLNLNS